MFLPSKCFNCYLLTVAVVSLTQLSGGGGELRFVPVPFGRESGYLHRVSVRRLQPADDVARVCRRLHEFPVCTNVITLTQAKAASKQVKRDLLLVKSGHQAT